MIYLASPYTSAEAPVMQQRYEAVLKCLAWYANKGLTVYSPIAHWHPVAVAYKLPRNFEFWDKMNKEFIARASQFHILGLPGWKESRGIEAELRFARHFPIPICKVIAVKDGYALQAWPRDIDESHADQSTPTG